MTISAKIVQGNDVELIFDVTDESGTAVVLDDAEIKWSMKPADNLDAAATLEKEVDDGIEISEDIVGRFIVTLDESDTNQSASCGDFVHEAVITFPGGQTVTVTDEDGEPGLLTIRRRITAA